MEQLLILLFVGGISLIKWLLKNKVGSPDSDEPSSRPAPRSYPPGSSPFPRAGRVSGNPEEERIRKFMEALGMPNDAAPKPVSRRTITPATRPQAPIQRRIETPPAVPPMPVPLPASHEVDRYFDLQDLDKPNLPKQIDLEPAPIVALPKSIDAYAFAVAKPESSTSNQPSLVELLHSRSGLRNAILLQEILGTPKGFTT